MSDIYLVPKDELYHYGVKGMKWGHRKNIYDVNANYYNKRAAKLSTRANKNRIAAGMNRSAAKVGNPNGVISKVNNLNARYYDNRANKLQAKANKNKTMARMNEAASKQKNDTKAAQTPEQIAARRKKALKIGAAVAGTALAAYGAHELNRIVKNKNYQIAFEKGQKAASKYGNFEQSYSISTFKDGTHQVRRTVNGKTRILNYGSDVDINAVSRRIDENMGKYHDRMNRKKNEVINSYTDKALNDNFRTAAKNVYDYYGKNRRKR